MMSLIKQLYTVKEILHVFLVKKPPPLLLNLQHLSNYLLTLLSNSLVTTTSTPAASANAVRVQHLQHVYFVDRNYCLFSTYTCGAASALALPAQAVTGRLVFLHFFLFHIQGSKYLLL